VARSEDWHWHEFGIIVQAIEGTARIEPYRVVFGFDRRPSEFTRPLDKPVAARI
jgi:hypothetical protein